MKCLGTAVCVLEMCFFFVVLFKSAVYTFTILTFGPLNLIVFIAVLFLWFSRRRNPYSLFALFYSNMSSLFIVLDLIKSPSDNAQNNFGKVKVLYIPLLPAFQLALNVFKVKLTR